MEHFLTYAIDKDTRRLVSVKDVKNGLACNCICPNCGADLVARQGKVRIPHFAHHNDDERSCSHEAAYESQIHQLSKEIIASTCEVAVPSFSYQGKVVLEEYCFHFESVELEKEFENGLRPDCVGIFKGKNGKRHAPIWIEINNTHAVDDEKKAQIVKDGIFCLEIDVSQVSQDETIDKEKLTRFLLNDASNRRWINYPYTPPKQQVRIFPSSQYHATRGGFVRNRRF